MTITRRPRSRCRLLAGVLLLLAAGCALPELAWQQADDVVLARADDWLDLDPRQERVLRPRIEGWLSRLRREHLADYAAFLEQLAARVQPGIDLEDARWASERFEQLYAGTLRSFLPVIAPTLAELSAEQREHLARRMKEANDEYRADFIDGRDDGMYALAEWVIDEVERWTGRLDMHQRDLVHRRVRELPRTQSLWLRFRQRMQQRLLAQIETGVPPAAIERTLAQWWIESLDPDDAPVAKTPALRDGLLRTLVALAHSLSPAQLAEARRRLHARAGTLRTLAASAG